MNTWKRLLEVCDNMEIDEAPKGMGGMDVGAGITTRQGMGAVNEPVKLTIGKQQLSFSPAEMIELIKSGDLQRMVQGGQVRKLPGVG